MFLFLVVLSFFVAAWEDAATFNEVGISVPDSNDRAPGDKASVAVRGSPSSEEGVSSANCQTKGCSVFVKVKEGGCWSCDTVFFCSASKPGTFLKPAYQPNWIQSNSVAAWDEDGYCPNGDVTHEDCETKHVEEISIGGPKDDVSQYLCSSKWKERPYVWAKCSADNKDKITRINNEIWQCIIEEGARPKWEYLGIDADGDSYLALGDGGDDCDDITTDDDAAICANVKTPEDCSSPESYHCAICINSGAPEVCGDSIENNDCNAETPNDCNKNQYACTQSPPPPLEDGTQPVTPMNVYEEKFAYVDGFCCGFNGIDDLGTVKSNLACLKKT